MFHTGTRLEPEQTQALMQQALEIAGLLADRSTAQ